MASDDALQNQRLPKKNSSARSLTQDTSDTPRTIKESNATAPGSTPNLKGAKSMPDLSPLKNGILEPERTPRRYGRPEIAFGTRVASLTHRDAKERLSPDIRQDIIANSRFGHSKIGSGKNKGLPSRDGDINGITHDTSRRSSVFTTNLVSDIDRDVLLFDE